MISGRSRKAAHESSPDSGSQSKTYNVANHKTGISYSGLNRFAADDMEGYYGATPAPGSGSGSNKYADLALVVAERAVTELSVVADVLLFAADIVDALVDYDGETSTSSYDFLDEFDYSSSMPEQSDHYRYYLSFVESGDLATWYSESTVESAIDGSTPSSSVFLQIEGGNNPEDDGYIKPANASPSDTEVQNLRRTTEGTVMYEEDGWTIEQIPVEKIRSRGRQLGFREQRIEDRLDRNEPVYFAHEANIKRIEGSP